MQYDNDNGPQQAFRTPSEHRLWLHKQSRTDEESHRGGAWPTGKRLQKAGNTVLLTALAGWQLLNSMPKLSAANDNQAVDFDHTETVQRDTVDADEIMEAIEKEKEQPGDFYRPDTLEVFVRGKWRSIVSETEFPRRHSSSTPGWLVDDEDEEEKMSRLIDCRRIRERLGDQMCAILDAAASDATADEIAHIAGCGRKQVAPRVDAAIEAYSRMAA